MDSYYDRNGSFIGLNSENYEALLTNEIGKLFNGSHQELLYDLLDNHETPLEIMLRGQIAEMKNEESLPRISEYLSALYTFIRHKLYQNYYQYKQNGLTVDPNYQPDLDVLDKFDESRISRERQFEELPDHIITILCELLKAIKVETSLKTGNLSDFNYLKLNVYPSHSNRGNGKIINALTYLKESLVNKKYIESTKDRTFNKLFLGGFDEDDNGVVRIKWLQANHKLKYFIEKLYKSNIVKNAQSSQAIQQKWNVVCNYFVDKDGERYINSQFSKNNERLNPEVTAEIDKIVSNFTSDLSTLLIKYKK